MEASMEASEWMTRAEACLMLKVSSRTLRRMVAQELFSPPQRIGNFRQLYFRRSRFLRERARAQR